MPADLPADMSAHDAGTGTDRALELLREVWGYDEFRGPQADIVAAVVAGRDCLVLMPTGGGKSICYQLPALLRPGLGIVVSPLIALMQDQVESLTQAGVAAGCLNSAQTPAERGAVVRAIETGRLKLLYVAPERILQEDTLAWLAAQPTALIAIDEAHCVSAWGHDFREEYLQLARLKEAFPGIPRLALTATADPRTREDIVRRLDLEEPARFIAGFDRPNIRYTVDPKKEPKAQLAAFLSGRRGESGIVYCLARKSVEATAAWLVERGYDALPYHAGLAPEVRSANQSRFLREDAVIMVATIAFGMGIDKPDVRFVAHMDLPKSLEAYYQETGRAGRDGAPAEAWMVYGLQDVVKLSQMLAQSQADERQKRIEREKLQGLLGWCEVTDCRRAALLAHFGESYPAPCGNCDVCAAPPRTEDGTEAAQKVLSCVYRTGQRFGAMHVIDVLRGATTDKIRQFGHERQSTFGIGAELSLDRWRSVIRQLLVQGYLHADPERFGALVLTPKSRALLRGEVRLALREEPAPAPRNATRVTAARKATRDDAVADADMELWEALRARRRELADEQGVPPYVIFHDATLKELARARPRTSDELLAIPGVGAAKLERYGAFFLEVIRSHT
jgi:ATP-dependent DNA helicase RecQ